MNYENRQVPEGINVSSEHPLKEFFSLLIAMGLLIVGTVVVLAVLAQKMAPLVPFHLEEKLLAETGVDWLVNEDSSDSEQAIENYLIELGEQLSRHMNLPDDMQLRIHYDNSDTVNAFASLAGHVVIHKGLLEKLSSENALAMVMAHEIAHVKLRHPIVAAGRGITVSLALLALGGFSENAAVVGLINSIGFTSTLSFNRNQESDADAEALNALLQHYGHVNGAEELFAVLGGEDAEHTYFDFFSTHPGTARRIEAIKAFAQAQGAGGAVRPLPASVAAALNPEM